MIRRCFGSSINVKTRKLLYISLVRSQLTYCSTIWRPQLLKDVALLESVQRRSTKWISDDYKSDYKSRLKALHLLPLMMVYELNDLSFFLKSLRSPSQSFNILDYVSFSSSSTRSFGIKLQHQFSRNNKSHHFFFIRLPRLWNSLPPLNLDLSPSQTISLIKRFFWLQFVKHFDSSNLCTYHFRCPCNRCFISSPASRFIA